MVKRKKLTQKQKKQRAQLLFTTLLVSGAFLLGLFFGDNSFNTQYIESKWQKISGEWMSILDGFSSSSSESSSNDAKGTFRFFDVGQGSATLMQSSDGTNILVDSGRYDDSDQRIISYLDRYIGTGGKIDLLIFTHNDADHIGNGDLILEYYQVEEVWMNGIDHTTRVYEQVLDSILASDAVYHEPKADETKQVGPFEIQVLSPFSAGETDDQNEESIVTRTTLNETSIMITGDVSSRVEHNVIDRYSDLHAEILLVGHHGSNDSTASDWLRAVNPEIGVVQAGSDNSYGHPHKEVLERIQKQKIPLYNTIEDGTVTISVDQNSDLTVETEKSNRVN